MSGADQHTCGSHAGLGSDLRGTALLLLERVRASVEPPGDDGSAPEPGSAGACQACPVCAVVAVLRGERSELAGRLAEHATGLVAVLTAVLAEAEQPRAEQPRAEEPRAEEPRAEQSRAEQPRAEQSRSGESPRPGYQPRVPGAHGRSVQRIAVHRR